MTVPCCVLFTRTRTSDCKGEGLVVLKYALLHSHTIRLNWLVTDLSTLIRFLTAKCLQVWKEMERKEKRVWRGRRER